MTQDYGNSGAPTLEPVTQAERRAATEGLEGRKVAATGLEGVAVAPPPTELEGYRSFVAAREYANAVFLVKEGKLIEAPLAMGMTPGVKPLVRREGDKMAAFRGGILVTDDPDLIAWCLAHPKVCRPSEDPMTKGWATMKDMQTPLANRDALVDASQFDADETFPPGLADRLAGQAQAAKVGSAGAEAVEAAETARELEQKRQAERAAEAGRLVP